MRKQMVAKKARMLDAAKVGGAAEGAIAGASASEAAARREARQEELNAKGAKQATTSAREYEELRKELSAKPSGMVKKWRGKGTKDSDDDDSDESDEGEKAAQAGLSLLEQRRAAFVKKKQETGGLSKKQRQEATLAKLAGFKTGLDDKGGGNDGTDTGSSWKAEPLKFEAVHYEAESASQYDSHDPLKHGTDGGRSAAKISARQQVMQSMKGGFFEEQDDEAASRPREVKRW